jgi:predicted nucleic acid-binding Zn ribbon protein
MFCPIELKFFRVYSCVLLSEKKKYQKSKSKEKICTKKEKKRISKERRRDKKGAHKEHLIALLFVVPFGLSVFSLLPFILVSLPCLS